MIIHYVNDPIGEESYEVQIQGKQKEAVKYEILIRGFHERFHASYPNWTADVSSLRLFTLDGKERDLNGFANENDDEFILISETNTRLVEYVLKKAKAAVGGFRTLTLVEANAHNSLGRSWYLREGLLAADIVQTARKETDEAKPSTTRIREMILSYKLGLALRRQHKSHEALKAFAKAATIAAYAEPPPSDLWSRYIYRDWGAAISDTSPLDRWNEIAIYKTAVQRNVWTLWYQRPVDHFDPKLTARPLWNTHIQQNKIISSYETILHYWQETLALFHSTELLSLGVHIANYFNSHDLQIPLPATTSQIQDNAFLHELSDLTTKLKQSDSQNSFRAIHLDVLAKQHREIRCAPTNSYLRLELLLHGASLSVLRIADIIVDDFHQPVTYDPSFEHELWYDYREEDAFPAPPRIAILIDVVHPDLSDPK